MAKTWILDSETKGTGAHMVPLEDTLRTLGGEQDLSLVTLGGAPRRSRRPAPIELLRFKVVDVMSARVVAEDVAAREAVEALEGMRSVLDARVFVWVERTRRWRLLSLDEQKVLWRFRGHAQHARL